jgi:hypothetical protein
MYFITRRVIAYELMAFISIISLIWMDEIFDTPHFFFGAESTPINWTESLFESAIISLLGAAILLFTYRLFRTMTHLEGILPICASCKKIRDENGAWHQLEFYISEKSEAEFSHGICPECARRLYADNSDNHNDEEPVTTFDRKKN